MRTANIAVAFMGLCSLLYHIFGFNKCLAIGRLCQSTTLGLVLCLLSEVVEQPDPLKHYRGGRDHIDRKAVTSTATASALNNSLPWN